MLLKPKPGSRPGETDPLCHVKSFEELTSPDSPDRENYRPGLTLLNQVRERDTRFPQTEEKPSRNKQLKTK